MSIRTADSWGWTGYIHSPRVLNFWWNGEIRLRGLQTAYISAGKEARPAVQPCDTLATLPSKLLINSVSHHRGARSSSGNAAHNGPIDLYSSQQRSSALWTNLLFFTQLFSIFPSYVVYINLKKLKKKKKKVIVNGSQHYERRVTCTSRSGLLGILAQYAVRIPLHADVRTELKTAVHASVWCMTLVDGLQPQPHNSI